MGKDGGDGLGEPQTTWRRLGHKDAEGARREGGPDSVALSFLVPRARVTGGLDIKELLRFVEPLFDGKHRISTIAVGQRPVIRKFPPNCRQLPPDHWDEAFLTSERVVVVIKVDRAQGEQSGAVQWLGDAPAAPLNTHEVLVVEMSVPPATKQRSASEVLKGAVKKVAREAGLDAPPVLQQAVMTGRLAYGKMAVPESQVAAWLKASGQNGLCVRPFFTAATPESINRGAFRVRWVKVGSMEASTIHRIWDAVRSCRGVWGLVLGDGDIGIRLRQGEADVDAVASALQSAGVEVKAKPDGVRWWCLEALRETELGNVPRLASECGLAVQGDVRFARQGPWRWKAFFRGLGEPHQEDS